MHKSLLNVAGKVAGDITVCVFLLDQPVKRPQTTRSLGMFTVLADNPLCECIDLHIYSTSTV